MFQLSKHLSQGSQPHEAIRRLRCRALGKRGFCAITKSPSVRCPFPAHPPPPSAIIDWIICAVVIAFALFLNGSSSPVQVRGASASSFSRLNSFPLQRHIPADDPSLLFPVVPDIVPPWVLALIVVVVPTLVFLLFQTHTSSPLDLHNALLALSAAVSFSFCRKG